MKTLMMMIMECFVSSNIVLLCELFIQRTASVNQEPSKRPEIYDIFVSFC